MRQVFIFTHLNLSALFYLWNTRTSVYFRLENVYKQIIHNVDKTNGFIPLLALIKTRMVKKKFKLSAGDKLSIFIASIALISAIFTTYIQFFHKTTEFRIGSVDFSNTKDSLNKQIDISILLINTGTNPVAFPEWYTYLSSDESLTEGVCYGNSINPQNTGLYTFGCSSRSKTIIEPNTV